MVQISEHQVKRRRRKSALWWRWWFQPPQQHHNHDCGRLLNGHDQREIRQQYLPQSIVMGCGMLLLGIVIGRRSPHVFSSASDDSDCTTLECITRKEDFKAQRQLEEELYREQYIVQKQRLQDKDEYYPAPTRRQIFDVVQDDILDDISEYEEEHPEMMGLNNRILPEPHWKGLSHPEINVVGVLKTGTSHLYNIFASHPDVYRPSNDEKEHCASVPFPRRHFQGKNLAGEDSESEDESDDPFPREDLIEYGLYNWHEYYYKHRMDGKLRINGCLNQEDNERHYVYSPPAPNTKYFVLLRDPADWLYAAFVFWRDHAWERFGSKDWVDANEDYRSPELFHEIILSGGKLTVFDRLCGLRDISVEKLLRLRSLVGSENLTVLKNEDLQPRRIHSSGLLQKISEATGLSIDGFDQDILNSRSNCNAKKGYGEKCTDNDREAGKTPHVTPRVGYPVTRKRPMLESTRRFIYLQWHKECKIWAEEFGVYYDECLAAIPDPELEGTKEPL